MTQISVDKLRIVGVYEQTANADLSAGLAIDKLRLQGVYQQTANADIGAGPTVDKLRLLVVYRRPLMNSGEVYIDAFDRLCVVGPLAAGTYSATVRVTDTNGATFDKELSFTVDVDGGISDGFILLEDEASFLLLEDGASKAQRETGI